MAQSVVEVAQEMTGLAYQIQALGRKIGFSPEGLDQVISDIAMVQDHVERLEADFEGDSTQGFEE